MIHLHQKVKDSISGFEGTVIGITQFHYGCAHICVVAHETSEGKPVEQWIDETRLDKRLANDPRPLHPFMGKDAKDSITGFKGVITGHTQLANGCERFSILSRTERTKDDGVPMDLWFDAQRLVVKNVAKAKDKKDKPGGPCSVPPSVDCPKR